MKNIALCNYWFAEILTTSYFNCQLIKFKNHQIRSILSVDFNFDTIIEISIVKLPLNTKSLLHKLLYYQDIGNFMFSLSPKLMTSLSSVEFAS